MGDALIIDGNAAARRLTAGAAAQVQKLRDDHGVKPGLAVLMANDEPGSLIYIRNKRERAAEVGIEFQEHRLPPSASEREVLSLAAWLNQDEAVDGIIIQLPLPAHVNAQAVVDSLDPVKDVDGFHVVNAGRLATGGDGVVPCTPMGCMMLVREARANLAGLKATVVGRSHIVGRPMARLLLNADCTVTVAHSKTPDLSERCLQADILVAAVGRPHLIRGSWIKPGATVIDVGINRIRLPSGKSRLVGDVAFDEAVTVAGAITPVPGGVGPMTVACLMQNTVAAAYRRRHLPLFAPSAE